jgi:general secretion pathway protein B
MDVAPPEKKDAPQPAPGQPPAPQSGKASTEPSPPKAVIANQPPFPIKSTDGPSPKATTSVKPSSKVVRIKQLPGDVKSKLPELKMTVHSYNEQSQSRFVVINNNTVREGQSVSADLKVEQITQNGVVLNYQGHRFSLGINETP